MNAHLDLKYDTVHRSHSADEFESHLSELAGFFSDAYGLGYNGDDSLSKKLHESDTIAQLYRGDTLVAVALSGMGRISSIGSASNLNALAKQDAQTPNRFNTMVQLLRSIKSTDTIDWISIGIEYDRMSSAASLAGLRRINCRDMVASNLDSVGEADRYEIEAIEDGTVIVKNGYVQKLYAKEGCDCHDRDETDRHMFE